MSDTMNINTELDAVNLLLSVIGETPVSSLEEASADVALAKQLLRAQSRDIQSEDWHFNSDYEYEITPNADGELWLPNNVLRVDAIRANGSSCVADLVQRGHRLYNRRGSTFQINKAVTVDITVLLPYDDLPEPAKRLIVEEAGMRFQASALGSDTLQAFTRERAQMARVQLLSYDTEIGDYNMLTDSQDFINMSSRRLRYIR